MKVKLYIIAALFAVSALFAGSDIVFASKTDTQEIPIIVFNTLSWNRTDAVDINSPFPGESGYFVVADKQGNACSGQNIGDSLRFTARNVPANGYKIFYVRHSDKPVVNNIKANSQCIENQFYKVLIDKKRGIIRGIYDKQSGKSYVSQTDGASVLQTNNIKNNKKSKWSDKYFTTGEVVMMDHGPANARVCIDHVYENMRYVQEIVMYDDIARIDVHLTASVIKGIPPLRVFLSSNLKMPKATFGNQLGVADWIGSRSGVCGVRWLDLSSHNYGISLLSDCKQGISTSANNIYMSLTKPDFIMKSDGMYGFNYSIYPHSGHWTAEDTLKRNYEIAYPLDAAVVKENCGCEGKSIVSLLPSNGVVLRILNNPMDRSGRLKIRVYETGGKAHDIKIDSAVDIKSVQETNELGKPIGNSISIDNGSFSVHLKKHEIKTFNAVVQIM